MGICDKGLIIEELASCLKLSRTKLHCKLHGMARVSLNSMVGRKKSREN
jgi:hypothetical protein